MHKLLNNITVTALADSVASLMACRILSFLGANITLIIEKGGIQDVLLVQDRKAFYEFLTEGCKKLESSISKDKNHFFDMLQKGNVLIYSQNSIQIIDNIISPDKLTEKYPELIVAIETPFGTSGLYNNWLTSEITDFAMGGYMQFCGHPDKEPLMIKGYQAQLHSGLQLAYAVIASYWHQLQTNKGTTLEVSRMESMLNAQVWYVPRWLQEGYAWPREESILIPCKNGYVIWGLQTPEIFLLIERIDLYEDPLYRTATGWNQEREAVKQLLKEWCLEHTKEEIYENAQALRITITPVNNIADILESEQFAHREWWQKKSFAEAGDFIAPSEPWKINYGTLNDSTNNHNERFSKTEEALPLKGVKVLEVTNNWAGPHAGRMLADLGAEVIVIERNHVQVTRSNHFLGGNDHLSPNFYNRAHTFNQLNRNKKGIVLDLSKNEGKEIFLNLAKQTDIIIENNSSRVFPNFGLSFEEIKKHNPNIILCSISGFGATGPQAHHVALGSNLEGSGGLVSTIGYSDSQLSESGSFYADPVGGSFGAIVSLSALISQQQKAQAMHIDLSLLESVALFISDAIFAFQNNEKSNNLDGNKSPYIAPQGAYQTAGHDCWIAIAIENDTQWNNLCQVIQNPQLGSYKTFEDRKNNETEIDTIIQQWVKQYDHYQATKILQEASVPAAPVLANWEIAADPHLYKRKYWIHNVHQDAGYQRWDGYPWRISKNWKMLSDAAPRFGEHNEEVLLNAGYTKNQVEKLLADSVISNMPADINMYID